MFWIKMLTGQNDNGSQYSLLVSQIIFCLLRQYIWNTIKIWLMRLTIDAPYDLISWQLLTIFGYCWEVILAVWLLAMRFSSCWSLVAVEALNKRQCMVLSAGTKKCGRCREVAVIGGSTAFTEKSWSCDISKFELFVCGRFRRNSSWICFPRNDIL